METVKDWVGGAAKNDHGGAGAPRGKCSRSWNQGQASGVGTAGKPGSPVPEPLVFRGLLILCLHGGSALHQVGCV